MSYSPVTIFCPELPGYVKDPQSGKLGSIKHMQIKSQLSPEKAIGFLYRNYATPSLSHTFLQLIKYASESVDNPGSSPLIALIGEKAAGKTSAASAAAYIVDGITPELFECGEKSLDELLWEPIIADSSRSLVARLEERYNSGSINPINKTFIETEMKDAITTDSDGKMRLKLELIGPNRIKDAINTIQTSLHLEGISAVTGIDITYGKGPLIRIWEKAVEAQSKGDTKTCRLIIDEMDKRIPGTGKSLQQVWLVLQGLLDEHTVSKNGMEFTFRRSEMPKGFSVVITSNDANDLGGETQAGLSQAQATRMTILPIDEPNEEDITHRICQFLTGIPFGFLDLIDQDKQTKGRILREIRTLGTDDTLSHEENWLLENYDKTLKAAKQLGAFYSLWGKMVSADDPMIDDPDLERNAAFREPPGVRMAHVHIVRARRNDLLDISFTPATPSDNPLQTLLAQKEQNLAKDNSIGERVCQVILEAIAKSTRSDVVKGKILEAAKVFGILDDPDEEKNVNTDHSSIKSLLNDKEENFKIDKRTKSLQNSLYSALVKSHGAKLGNPPPQPDEILPLRDLQAALDLAQELAKAKTTGETTYMLNINPKFLEGNRLETAVECIPVLSPSSDNHREKLKSMTREEIHSTLMQTDTLMAVLKTPEVSGETLAALWNQDWRDRLDAQLVEDKTKTVGEESPENVKMADGSSQTLRIAKVLTMGKDGTEASLIFQSLEKKQTWIISENGKPDKVESKDWTLTCYGEQSSEALWGSIQAQLGPDIEPDVRSALRAFHSNEEPTTEMADAMAAAFQSTEMEREKKIRVLRNTKLPLRIPLEAEAPTQMS